MEHDAMKRISKVCNGVASQIVYRRYSCEPIPRMGQATIKVKIVIVTSAQLQRDQVSVFTRDGCRPAEVPAVVLQLGSGHRRLMQLTRNQRRRIMHPESFSEPVAIRALLSQSRSSLPNTGPKSTSRCHRRKLPATRSVSV